LTLGWSQRGVGFTDCHCRVFAFRVNTTAMVSFISYCCLPTVIVGFVSDRLSLPINLLVRLSTD
jgi:hypothetical protein